MGKGGFCVISDPLMTRFSLCFLLLLAYVSVFLCVPCLPSGQFLFLIRRCDAFKDGYCDDAICADFSASYYRSSATKCSVW